MRIREIAFQENDQLWPRVRRFCGLDIGGAVIPLPLTEQLSDYFLDRHLLDVDVANVTSLQQLPARFGDFGARDFQLD